MYHSVSEGAGPTCIPAETFRGQMAALAACGYRAVTLRELVPCFRGGPWPADRVVALTFDDGFQDFATVAAPELGARGWSATVFLPAAKVSGAADWEGAGGSRSRPLLSWGQVRELAAVGVEFGAHGLRHADLTALPPEDAREEVAGSKRRIEDEVGRPVVSFAAPYGRTTPAVRAEVGRHFQAAVGTALGAAGPASDPYDLPRLEMWYFRNPRRWRAYLEGGARGYFLLRQVLRRVRGLVRGGRTAAPVAAR
jgi:peptidoglycan/xylan/chitin deacetylase (PgdA/CDA1 family)